MMKNISNKDHEILQLMWEKNIPLTARQICDEGDQFIMSTVQTSLRKLLKNKLIAIDDIVYSGTSLTRSYRPTLSMEEFILKQYESVNIEKFMTAFMDTLSSNPKAELGKIEDVLNKYRGID